MADVVASYTRIDACATPVEINRFLDGCHLSIICSSFPTLQPNDLFVEGRIHCSSAEHSVWNCLVTCTRGQAYQMVLKFKQRDDELYLMSQSHGDTMRDNYTLVQNCIDESGIGRLSTGGFIYLEVARPSGSFRLWLEEYLPNFQKFLRFPDETDINLGLSVTNSSRLFRLQTYMRKRGLSPIIDCQGGFSDDWITLSDIETTDTLEKFVEIDPALCLRYIIACGPP